MKQGAITRLEFRTKRKGSHIAFTNSIHNIRTTDKTSVLAYNEDITGYYTLELYLNNAI